jgi:hypothetical protein
MREEEAQICGTRCLNLELGFWDLGFYDTFGVIAMLDGRDPRALRRCLRYSSDVGVLAFVISCFCARSAA